MTTQNPTTAPPVTLEEFAALPEYPRYELVEGVLVEQMGASDEHEETVALVIWRLSNHVYPNRLGKVYGSNRAFVTVPESPASSRMPDVSFLSAERATQPDLFGMLYDGSPDLAVEIISPSNTVPEILRKIAEYLASGSKAVWVISYTARILTIHTLNAPPQTLTDADTVSGGEALPGFSCPVAALLPSND